MPFHQTSDRSRYFALAGFLIALLLVVPQQSYAQAFEE
jgi:hypothetical protein